MRGDPRFKHACLRHLERAGFAAAPRLLGLDEQGWEVLSFLPGEVPADLGFYPDRQLEEAALLLRRFHDATTDMEAVRACGLEVACHNDWAPTNTVFDGGRPVGMIDFDTAALGLRLWDLGYAAFTWLDLGNEAYSGDDQIRRLSLFTRAYGAAGSSLAEVAVFVIARQAALATATKSKGRTDVAAWAVAAAEWTALHILERVLPTGYRLSSPGGRSPDQEGSTTAD